MTKKDGSPAEQEMKKLGEQFDAFDKNVKEMTLDRLSTIPEKEQEKQTKIAQADMDKDVIYLKPIRSISCRDKFNEAFRKDYDYSKEYVSFIAEHKEIIGDCIEAWTRPYGGMPAEEWKVPTNKVVWGPRYLAEQIKRKKYHRLVMQDRAVNSDSNYTFTGAIVADSTIQRLDAYPATQQRSVFMGARNF